MKIATTYKLFGYFVKTVFVTIIYLSIYFAVNKIILNKIMKSIIIGLVTPFFAYQFIINFIHPVSYFLYLTKIYNPSVAILLVSIIAKPLSIIIGIMTTIVLLTKEDLIKAFKEDISNTLNNTDSKKR